MGIHNADVEIKSNTQILFIFLRQAHGRSKQMNIKV